jgi:tetratricopeptide (TPR) repeat protein
VLRDFTKAFAQHEAALAAATDSGLRQSTAGATLLVNYGVRLAAAGLIERAVAMFIEAAQVDARQSGQRGHDFPGAGNLAAVWLLQGKIRQALDLVEKNLPLARELGSERDVAYMTFLGARLWCEQGDVAMCAQYVDRSREMTTRMLPATHARHASIYLLEARLQRLRGRPEHERSALRTAVARMESATSRPGNFALALGRLALAEQRAGDAAEAERLSDRSLVEARKSVAGLSTSAWLGETFRLRAQWLVAAGRSAEARDVALQAQVQLRESLGADAPAAQIDIEALLAAAVTP